MLDKDLAELYAVKAIRLREQVKRNSDRFPDYFKRGVVHEPAVGGPLQNAIPSKQSLGGHFPYVFRQCFNAFKK